MHVHAALASGMHALAVHASKFAFVNALLIMPEELQGDALILQVIGPGLIITMCWQRTEILHTMQLAATIEFDKLIQILYA